MTYWTVTFAASLTAIATGLGALPFLFAKNLSRRWIGISNGLAAGLMLGACHGLIAEGIHVGLLRTMSGMVLGVVFLVVASRMLPHDNDLTIGSLKGASAMKAIMFIGVMTLHSFSEGIGVGVSFGGGEELGIMITAAIAVHNIPEGLAISLMLVPRGVSVGRAAWWSIFSSLPQPLMALPAFLFVTAFREILPAGLGFASGAMIYMVFSDLIPDANNDVAPQITAITVTMSMAAMIVLQQLL